MTFRTNPPPPPQKKKKNIKSIAFAFPFILINTLI